MNIVIVGGGTAGWVCAYYLQQSMPSYNITVIESSQVGIIGAGEGGTHIIGSIIDGQDIESNFDIKDFIIKTDAAYKHGVKHCNWTKENTFYYNPLDLNQSTNPAVDDYLAWQIFNNSPIHPISDIGLLIYNNRTVIYKDESGFAPFKGYSYHFDGRLVGQFFKDKTNNATVIDSVVQQVILNESGNIQSILLDNQDTIHGDLFIDCTGFARVLSKAVGSKWVSYRDNLLMNSALPFQLNYEPPCTVEPISIATALSAGWVWQLSLAERWGCGYVFCDQFINFNQAQQEIENFIGKEIIPIKQIKFDPGRLDQVWIKNCVSLGLASAFVEPLEATSIHTTVMQIQKLSTLLKNEITDKDIDNYNNEVATAYDEIKEFIVLHYMGGRNDSEFWRTVSSQTCTDFVKNILNIAKHRLLTAADIPNKNTNISYQSWNQVIAGLGLFSKETVSNHLKDKNIKDQYYSWRNDLTAKMEQCKSVDDILENGKFKL